MTVSAARVAAGASVALAISSLVLPSFGQAVGQTGSPGILVLAFGWLGLIAVGTCPANLAWLANVALIGAWGFCHERMREWALAASSLAIGLATLPLIYRQVATDEAGMPRPIATFGSGYIAWAAAMAAALVWACLLPPARRHA